jgi:hypothetical protein
MVISISNAIYLEDYKISFSFSDQTNRMIDFYPFLQNAKNPMVKKYLNKPLFRNFKIEYGDIQWNDYELCFPIWDLYQGDI